MHRRLHGEQGRAEPGRLRAPIGRLPFLHAVVLDGQVVGHWRRAPGDAATLEAHLARPLDAGESRALAREVDRYGDFLGAKAVLRRFGRSSPVAITPSAARGSG